MANHHPTGRDKQKIPSKVEQQAIRRSLGMRHDELFARCRGKNRKFLRAREREGDTSHSAKAHICDECRCKRVAGTYTGHYGVGYCYDHEGVTGMTKHKADLMVQTQKTAMRMGLPDNFYKYKTNQAFIKEIREAAEAAGGTTDLREEVNVLRTLSQDLLDKFQGNTGLTEGYDKEGNPKDMTDATYYKLMSQLMTSVGKLTKDNLTVTEHDYIHVDQMNIWFAQVIQLLRQHVEPAYPDVYTDLIEGIKLIPTMKKGRIN